ncbi:AraC family transcriptional regulator [Janthinobacterium sp. SUN118]|uniref:helix-turn-helix transcriptional regulator n=1 Tax=Janthinobacterium sp. SUN118 TaxID=3004100 RepID=UPI0025B202C3|nr:AraC family transcriptional regulator [Janthinobacterium sp. SUN118]MDN2710942.1 AraC family transcriptional regulator [Janthinobacterium sp. SUN118]
MPSPPLLPNDASWQLPLATPRLELRAGTLSFAEPAHSIEHNEAGLKLVLVLGGQLDYQLQSGAAVNVEGPAFHISLSETPFAVSHRYAARQALQYLSVRMPMDALHDTFGAELGSLARRIAPATRQAMATANGRAGKVLQALGRQIMLCPLAGPLRQLYLSGKALELTAAVMDGLADTRTHAAAPGTRQLRSLQQARDILLQRLHAPPTLPELARLAGTNASTLSQGFRQLFGTSVFAYVREQRLELAYRMLASGNISVADAAHACGYTDSHFSKVFRQRYGVSPSDMRCA